MRAAPRGLRADLCAAAAGVLAALALPPVWLVPLLFVALPALAWLIDAAPSPAVAFRRGFVFALAHHLAGLWWVTNAILVMAAEFWWAVPLAVPALAAVLALFVAVPCALARAVRPGLPRLLVLASAWCLGDLARQFVLTGFPWNPLASIWSFPGAVGVAMLQPLAWLGTPGLTLLTVFVALLPRLGRRGGAASAAILLAWAGAGAARLAAGPAGLTPLSIVIVQNDVPELEHRDHGGDPAWVRGVFERALALTRQGAAQVGTRPFLVLWPETGSPYLLPQDAVARAMIAEASVPAIASLVGTVRGGEDGRYRNSLAAVLPDGSVGAIYDKQHLVPYGEYMPAYLPFRLGELGFEAGPGLRTLHVPGLPPLAPLICYEAIFPGQVVAAGDRPAAIVNITNDAWFGDSAGPRQHLAAVRMRAVEEGLPVLRAANTGISAVIDAEGRLRERLGLDRAGVIVARVPAAREAPLFAEGGLAIPLAISLFGCAAGVLFSRMSARLQAVSYALSKSLDDGRKT